MKLKILIVLSVCVVLATTGLCRGSMALPLHQPAAAGRLGAIQIPAAGSLVLLSATMLPRPELIPVAVEAPLPPEKNPPGDIPDSQVFITYASASGGYGLKVPEGWARSVQGANVRFTRYFDGLSVAVTKASQPPTVETVRSTQAEHLKKTGRAVTLASIRTIRISHRPVVLMTYRSNSAPNPVTNKRVRLENAIYFYYRSGKLAALRLWEPLGADNVDQWKLISHSFKWR
ncbi:MAG: hypothetical protein ACK2UW_13235 [Anaerolineales bacterium]